MKIVGYRSIPVAQVLSGETQEGELRMTLWSDGSTTAFYTQPGANGPTVYLTYSDLKVLKAALVNMKDDAW